MRARKPGEGRDFREDVDDMGDNDQDIEIGLTEEYVNDPPDDLRIEDPQPDPDGLSIDEYEREAERDGEERPEPDTAAESDAVSLGDSVYVLAPDAGKQRPRLRVYDPGFYFPDTTTLVPGWVEDDYPPIVHIAWEETDADGRIWVVRSTWRMVALDAEWSHCMADAGFPDIEQQAAVQTTWLQMAYPEDAPFSEPGDDLIALEIQLALADFDCRAATGFDEREREIRLDIENRLLAENRAVVDELLALVQSVRS